MAGQQEKFALAQLRTRDGRPRGWAEAKGSAPTTHIVKPGIGRLRDQALVEHATMRAAAALGVEVARTEFTDFGGQTALIVERFDRVQLSDGSVQRIHQEDLCQAMGRKPEDKYEEDGGPTAKDMARILRAHAYEPGRELRKLADFILINHAAAAPDGHSKNVSIRILPNGDVRMAPLYDLATGVAYDKETVDRRLACRSAASVEPTESTPHSGPEPGENSPCPRTASGIELTNSSPASPTHSTTHSVRSALLKQPRCGLTPRLVSQNTQLQPYGSSRRRRPEGLRTWGLTDQRPTTSKAASDVHGRCCRRNWARSYANRNVLSHLAGRRLFAGTAGHLPLPRTGSLESNRGQLSPIEVIRVVC